MRPSLKYFTYQSLANTIGSASLILNAVTQIIFAPVAKSCLGDRGLGVWYLIFQTFVFLQLLDLGLSDSIIREIAVAKTTQHAHNIINVNVTSKRLLAYVGMLFAIGGIICAFTIPIFIELPDVLKNDFMISILLLSFWGFFRYYIDLPRLCLRGMNKIVEFNWLALFDGVGRPVAGIIFLILLKKMYGIVIGYIFIELITRIIATKILPISYNGTYSKECFRELARFGRKTSVARISTLILFYSSSFMIGWTIDVKAIAIYQCSIALPLLLLRFGIIPFTNLLPLLIKKFKLNGIETLRKFGIYSHIKIVSITFFLYLVIVAGNGIFVKLWVGSSLFAGYLFTAFYSLFCLLSIARHNGYMMYQATGILGPIVIAHLIEIPLNLFLILQFIDRFGLIGVPIAFVLSHLIVFLVAQIPFLKFKRPIYNFTNTVGDKKGEVAR